MSQIRQLIGFRNRLLPLINWVRDCSFYDRAARLTSPGHPPAA